MSDTSIEWTEKTWNPVTGCSKVSPGCAHCYAEGVALRFWRTQYPPVPLPTGDPSDPLNVRPREFTDVLCHDDRLAEPLRWRKPTTVFVNSMSDLFHEDVPDAFIDRVFAVMALTPQHTYQILTKRPARLLAYLTSPLGLCYTRRELVSRVAVTMDGGTDAPEMVVRFWPLLNVWLGVSVENQHFADELIPLLLQTPAAIRFISVEPLLSGLDLRRWIGGSDTAVDDMEPEDEHCVRCGCFWDPDSTEHECPPGFGPRLNWVIVGGESGPGARPFNVAWARSIVAQCKAAGVPVFVKQLGRHVRDRNDAGFEGDTPTSWPMDTDVEDSPDGFRDEYQGAPVRVRLVSPKGGDMAEWPSDLRVREMPAVRS